MMVLSIIVGSWGYPLIKPKVHAVLDPTFGKFILWNTYGGMIFIVFVINLLFTGVQKVTVDPEELKLIKEKQQFYQQEMKKYKEDPVKLKELQLQQMAEMPEMFSKNFEIYMKSLFVTAIPIILFFCWFNDFFTSIGNPHFFGFMSWFWFYLLLSIFLSGPIRKIYKM